MNGDIPMTVSNTEGTTVTIDPTRLARIAEISLSSGSHEPPNGEFQACVMEAVAYVAGEMWADRPACACPVITVDLVNRMIDVRP